MRAAASPPRRSSPAPITTRRSWRTQEVGCQNSRAVNLRVALRNAAAGMPKRCGDGHFREALVRRTLAKECRSVCTVAPRAGAKMSRATASAAQRSGLPRGHRRHRWRAGNTSHGLRIQGGSTNSADLSTALGVCQGGAAAFRVDRIPTQDKASIRRKPLSKRKRSTASGRRSHPPLSTSHRRT